MNMPTLKTTLARPLAALLLAAALPAVAAAPAHADALVAASNEGRAAAKFEENRKHILAMAGKYNVHFDFRETTPWNNGYDPIETKTSGGHELVKVIADTGRFISLQHLLVVQHEGKSHVIKHWRQDWTYEPESVLVYKGAGEWKLETVPEQLRKGRWSQTVWQVDDSPRYGGWGQWTAEGGVPRWRSSWTYRPLARRDAVRTPVYDRYLGINRHSPTPSGWVHWQDNIKVAQKDGKDVPYVQEIVLNTYDRYDGFNAQPAEDYWEKTNDFWAVVRTEWHDVITRNGGVSVREVADTGSASAEGLMTVAQDLADGKISLDAAIPKARQIIAIVTRS